MNSHAKRICLLFWAAALLAKSFTSPVLAQVRINFGPPRRVADLEAVTGGRFGVGRITVDPSREMLPEPLGVEGFRLNEKHGRVLYPAVKKPVLGGLAKEMLLSEGSPLTSGGPVREEVGGLLRGILDRPPKVTIYFLFRGEGPLELTLQGRLPQTFSVTPRRDPVANGRLLRQWWKQYTAPPRLLQKQPDYPPLVENYLKSTLARRLSLNLPKKEQTDRWQDRLKEELGLTLGTESIRLAMQQDRILGLNNLGQVADRPLPESRRNGPINPPAIRFPPTPDGVKIEPIAMRVPGECFYMHFGSFANFLWMQDTLKKWGGDLQNLLASRGLDYGRTRRVEEQLVVKQTVLARLFGGTLVSDVAIIGTDTFLREGAAYGILFYARQSKLLGTNLTQERLKRLKKGGVTEKKLQIAGHTVSYLASPGGRVRSYYAADGDYHFVTSSNALVRRFLETRSGKGALGASKDFRHARTMMPLANKYTVFVYLSDAFFRNFTGPHYRVEMVRRLQAASDIDLVQLAVLASATEGKPGDTIQQLIAGELLPPDFATRPDGSRTVLKDGIVYDSLRGHRGAFLPVPDTPVKSVSRAELSAYKRFADFYREKWGRLDPTMIGVQRHALKGNREKVVLDVHLSPFAAEHFELLSKWAGPPDKMQLAPIKGNIAAGELVWKDRHIYAGLSADNRFTVLSLHQDELAAVTPQLKFEEADRPAQLRLRIGDLSQARMPPFLNNWGYARTCETSLGNIRLMHALDQQLHVPPEDCREAAEFLVDAKLICPLGGDYVFKKADGGTGWWTSTALQGNRGGTLLTAKAPEGYQAPPLNWFRGLKLDASMTRKVLSAHAEIIMQLPARK